MLLIVSALKIQIFLGSQEEMSLIVLKKCTMFHTIMQYTISLYFILLCFFFKLCSRNVGMNIQSGKIIKLCTGNKNTY